MLLPVYSGQYQTLQVAVKMIVHTARTSRLIENEVLLSKSLCHPNVIQTLNSINFRELGRGYSGVDAQAEVGHFALVFAIHCYVNMFIFFDHPPKDKVPDSSN